MIKYALSCAGGHEFEGWFGSSADYDDQSARGLVSCPVCGLHDVQKQIMAPAVAGTRDKAAPEMIAAMDAMRAKVEAEFDDVGGDFASEARAIHEGRAEERGIYGEATGEEVRALVEDGVPVAPMPPRRPRKSDIH